MDSVLKLSEISTWGLQKTVSEVFFIMIGIVFILTGIKALKDSSFNKRISTAAFWFILAFSFIAGPYLPKYVTGLCVIVLAIITAFGGVKQSKSDVPAEKETRENANKLGYKIFIPTLGLAVVSVLVATFWKDLGANNAIGVSAIVALCAVLLLTKAKPSYVVKDGTRLMDNVGTVGILPQVLAALGALFTSAGVGDVIADLVKNIIPEGSIFAAVVVYCVAMALFTAIMGNGFAAFSVITVGIGIPFLIAKGGNPLVIGALGLTAGYCGTLMTPMAANFNIMPAALLEMKDKYGIIKMQIPIALTMLIAHIILMSVLAF